MSDYLGPYLLGPNDTPENGIYCGDARELARAIPDESVDLILCDPPFGIGYSYANGYKDDPAIHDDLMRWLAQECERIIRPGGYCFVFQAGIRLRNTWQFFPAHSEIFAACKNFTQGGRGEVLRSFDPVIYWRKGDPRLPGLHRRDWFLSNTSATRRKRGNEFHSCPRPLDVCEYIVGRFSLLGDVVLDAFAGSGTTAVAAKRHRRRWLAFEIDPDTCAMARERVRNTQPPLFVPEPEQLSMEGLT